MEGTLASNADYVRLFKIGKEDDVRQRIVSSHKR